MITVGLGSHFDADLLTTIAELSGGRFHGITELEALPGVFRAEVARLVAP